MNFWEKHSRILRVITVGFALLALTACGTFQTPPAALSGSGSWIGGGGLAPQLSWYPVPVIQVSGVGKASGAPDLANLSLAISVTAETVAGARLTAATTTDQVITSLTDNAIDAADIVTSHFSVQPEFDYGENGPTRTGYIVSNGLAVMVRDIDNVGVVIDDAIAAGGDDITFNSLSFSTSDTSALKREARQAAVDNMQSQAAQLAEFAGLQLGDIRQISETPFEDVAVEAQLSTILSEAVASFTTPTFPGQTEVTATVHGLYEILPSE